MIDTPLNLREVGRLRVLQALHDAESTSRSELAQVTGLSRATVSSLVTDLLAAGLVEENEPDAQARPTGRPAQPLALRASAAYAVGTDIGSGGGLPRPLDSRSESPSERSPVVDLIATPANVGQHRMVVAR